MGRLCMALLLVFMFSCQGENNDIMPAYPLEEGLIAFSFLQENNQRLPVDSKASLTGTRISVNLPSGIPRDSLIAAFTPRTPGSKVYIGNTLQTSNTTANDFSAEVVYKVVSEDGRISRYRVEFNSLHTEIDEAMEAAIKRHNLPGVSIAIARGDRLIFSKGYGYANRESAELVSTGSLFRIASLSKPITSAAILRLVQEGKLSFSDRVFGPNGILTGDYPSPPARSNIDLITVRHLLDHTSGWTNNPNDPIFADQSLSAKQIISNQINGRPLEHLPGTTYCYFNLGYCILGRVIEKVTGKSYSQYVQETFLHPLGISTMRIAGDTKRQQVANEVRYYQNEQNPYSFKMARMDANGGWIATAEDMVKFMVLVDTRSPQCRLSAQLLESTYFGYPNWSHFGSLPGTTSVMTRLNNEFSYVVMANSRNNNSPSLVAEDLDRIIKHLILTKEDWPAVAGT